MRSRSKLVVRRSALPAADRCRRGGLPVTTPTRTAFDLARRLDLVEAVVAVDAVDAVDALLYRRVVTSSALAGYVPGHEGWRASARRAACSSPPRRRWS